MAPLSVRVGVEGGGRWFLQQTSQIEHCVFNCFAVVCNDVYSVYIFESFKLLFWCESLSFEGKRCGCVYVALEKGVVFRHWRTWTKRL